MAYKRYDETPPDLDPEVAALVQACKNADEEKKRRNGEYDRAAAWGLDGKPIELKLRIGPTALICSAAGLLSALGGLILLNWAEAGALHLLVSQLPAASLIAYAFVRAEKKGAAR